MRRLALALIAVTLTAPSLARAGPFGFSMGEPISKYKVEKTSTPGVYQTTTAPSPHSKMDIYTITASPTFGVCKVGASTRDHEDDAYGSELKDEFSTFRQALIGKYGNPSRDFDFLKVGAIWTEPREYTMSIKSDERRLISFWEPSPSDKFDHITNITMEARALSLDTNYISISYEFSNFDKCLSEINKETNSSL